MGDLGLSGLASGVDTSAIVAKLMAVESQGRTKIALRQAAVQGQQSALKDIQTRLASLRTAATDLRSGATWAQTQAVESTDTRVGVAKLSGAGIGGHTIQVDRMASSAQLGFGWTPDTAAPHSFTITNQADPAKTMNVSVAAGASIEDVATAINGQASGPVAAAVVADPSTGDKRLVLAARTTGALSTFTVGQGDLTGQLAADPAYTRTTDLDAAVKVDGVAVGNQHANVSDNLVPGLRITLKGVTSSPATISVGTPGIDKDAVAKKAKAFVDAYNNVVDMVRDETSEKKVANAANAVDAAKGQLFGDTGLTAMLTTLKQKLTGSVGGLGSLSSLAAAGISVPRATGGASSDDAKAGKLVFDATALSTALDTDWTQVRQLFDGKDGAKGFAAQIQDYVDTQTGGHGVLDARQDGDARRLTDLRGQLAHTDDQLAAKQTRLKAQFAAMESALQSAQTQQAWLTGQISSLR